MGLELARDVDCAVVGAGALLVCSIISVPSWNERGVIGLSAWKAIAPDGRLERLG